jgi:hypothetical protein
LQVSDYAVKINSFDKNGIKPINGNEINHSNKGFCTLNQGFSITFVEVNQDEKKEDDSQHE